MSFPVVATSFGVSQSGSQAGEKKGGYVHYEVEPGFTIRMRHDIDPTTDPKKLKRIISNRVAAQKSRWKKVQYIDALVKRSMELQGQVSMLRSELAIASEQKRRLENEQRQLKEYISARLQRCIDNDGVIKEGKAEIERLKNNLATLSNLA
ncbi:Basic-leucine zipper domain [Arabidopsis thaliana x Arabidopsis arenosa]|uniref:Basic-leucine zipper domain n=1 Tax=Arabidopsis thaliana x Arabidopsis arenosa TaxID=1240361 RepID=A0A8T1YVL4_9BRAS|nr:Basic-leucine zipper domain [Arabidopsis thaliana x Arabidopsis arenosa]